MFKFKEKALLFVLLTFVLVLAACSGATEDEEATSAKASTDVSGTITVSAAASLTDALQEVAELYNEENPDVQVDFNFGGSGALRQQISQGAPADMFFSASQSDFDTLVEGEFINEEDSTQLLKNELVLVVPEGDTTVTSFDDITEAEQIAVGTPESVPAGEYAMETFDTMGLTEEIESSLVYAEDVRAVLTYVERGEVNAGLVYRTDAMTSDSVEIVDAAPADAHDPIEYPVGLISESENTEAARSFYDFIQTYEALEVFGEYGFVTE